MERLCKLGAHLSAANCAATAAPTAPEILYQKRNNGVAVITLNRPERLNSLTGSMQVAYFDTLEKARDDPEVKVIVVTGSGRGFCAGVELEVLDEITKKDGNKDSVRITTTRDLKQIQAVSIPKPIIAAINGPCAGLGFVLATMTDLRFAVRNAKFTSSFSKRGLPAEHGVSFFLQRIVGMSNAMDLLLSSRVILGDEAKQMGFVQKLFDTNEGLMKYTLDYAAEMAKWCSPASLQAIKKQIYTDSDKDIYSAWKNADSLMHAAFDHPDFVEGVQSYLDKRSPQYKGLVAGSFADLVKK